MWPVEAKSLREHDRFYGKAGLGSESPGHVSLPLKQAHPSDSANGAGNARNRSLGEDSLLSKEAPNGLY